MACFFQFTELLSKKQPEQNCDLISEINQELLYRTKLELNKKEDDLCANKQQISIIL